MSFAVPRGSTNDARASDEIRFENFEGKDLRFSAHRVLVNHR